MNVTIDKYCMLCNQPSFTQTQSIFIWPIRAIRRSFGAGSMSSILHSSQYFPSSKAPSGYHCYLQVRIVGCSHSNKIWYCSVELSAVQSAPFTLLCLSCLCKPCILLETDSSLSWEWVLGLVLQPIWLEQLLFACAYLVTEDIRSVFQRGTIILFHCSQGEICQQLYKNWAQTLIWKTDEWKMQ